MHYILPKAYPCMYSWYWHAPVHALALRSVLPANLHMQVQSHPDATVHVWVQVTVLDVLDQEGALHLLPSMEKAPSLENYAVGQNLYGKTEPPAEVLRVYRQLLDEGSLRKAHELGSLPHGIATKWA